MIQFTWWTVVHCIFFFFIIVAVLLFNMQSFEYICFKYPCIKVFKANWTLESLKLMLASILLWTETSFKPVLTVSPNSSRPNSPSAIFFFHCKALLQQLVASLYSPFCLNLLPHEITWEGLVSAVVNVSILNVLHVQIAPNSTLHSATNLPSVKLIKWTVLEIFIQ